MDFNLDLANLSSENNIVPLEKGILYDVIIIGGGPAGLTAAVYCMRKGVRTGILLRTLGGQVSETADVENYMGYRHISGIYLVNKFREQVSQFSIAYEDSVEVTSIGGDREKTVTLSNGKTYRARSLIIASGKRWRRLGVPGEDEYIGRGVAFCSICDGPLFTGKHVVVVGGGNTAAESIIDLCPLASSLTVVQFLESMTADEVFMSRLSSCTGIDYRFEHEVLEMKGDGENLTSVVIRNRKTDEVTEIPAQGLFLAVGMEPNSGFAEGVVELNKNKEINVDCTCRTNMPGIFAAGDVTSVPYKQIIVAAGEGAKAALAACDYIRTE